MKSINELSNKQKDLLLFLFINSERGAGKHVLSISSEEKPWTLRDNWGAIIESALDSHRLIKLELVEEFLEEKYDFEKFFRDICESGHIVMDYHERGTFYGSNEYREIFKYSTGLVKNYDTGEVWVRFHLTHLDERNNAPITKKLLDVAEKRGLIYDPD